MHLNAGECPDLAEYSKFLPHLSILFSSSCIDQRSTKYETEPISQFSLDTVGIGNGAKPLSGYGSAKVPLANGWRGNDGCV